MLILSEVYYPAWHAYVDRQPTQLYIADHALRGIAVPAGAHTVEIRYESLSLNVGLAITLFAGVALLALTIGTLRAARRQQTF